MDLFHLSNGKSIPSIALGTFKSSRGIETYNAVLYALKAGYKHIDTAAIYDNEEDVGKALADSGINRKDIFVTTKLWNTFWGEKDTIEAFNASLDRLKLDYIDLYLIHWPRPKKYRDNYKEMMIETYHTLEDLYNQGKIKSIGVSNFLVHHLEFLLDNVSIKPVVNQIEFHAGYTQNEVVEYCKKHNILVEAWAPIGQGSLLKHPLLISLAEKYNKSTAQICIRYCLEKGVLPLPKSVVEDRIISNLNVFDFSIDKDDILKLDNMEQTGFSGLDPDNIDF